MPNSVPTPCLEALLAVLSVAGQSGGKCLEARLAMYENREEPLGMQLSY